ncbi:sensor domain-containing diguanylate cyclase [Shewanella pneumatophori]|uniref:diguanylate cyclase n=1 Tax=Shewanella pneumatophori TaxID=314092 RepID=A0A9X2CCK1_9GAMM|nr:diguanylate cyclase [Shewanella pneumatophori]MCL1136982.1 diguanylate cyclase [Shewanella pneumatophori]
MNRIDKHKLLFATILGLIGFTVNLYPIHLFANVQLILGNVAYVISAILLGPWYALYTAMIALSGLMIAWDSLHVYFLFGIEAIFLGLARRRDIYALYANFGFWLILGMPLFYLYLSQFTELPNGHVAFISLKQGINGLVYTSIGSLLIILTPSFWHFKDKIKDIQRRTFNAQLTYTFSLIITVTLLIAALMFNNQFIERHQSLLYSNIKNSADNLAASTQSYLDVHSQAITNAAQWLSLNDHGANEEQILLSQLHANYPGFITMLLADEQANIIGASPASLLRQHSTHTPLNIAERDYFIEAFINQRTFTSPLFVGKGFGNDPIVAISAPLYHPSNVHEPIGIVEGSLDLNQFKLIDEIDKHNEHQTMLLIDENMRIIYASESLGLATLSEFNYSRPSDKYISPYPMINISQNNEMAPEYVYASVTLTNGWKLFILNPFRPLAKLVENMYLATFAILILSLVIAIYLSRVVSSRLTLPLENIANKFSTQSNKTDIDYAVDNESPKEIFSLFQRLQQSKSQLIGYQLELEEKVAMRTVELEHANSQLKALAEKDSLTGLYNRRYAENKFAEVQELCQRSDEVIAIALLDLDKFKFINDTYGHHSGDLTLKAVAEQLLYDFKRNSDIVVRYGGEEFLLIMPLCNALKIEEHLDNFRQRLAKIVIENKEDNHQFNVTTSIGAVLGNGTYSTSLEDWVKQADINLYQAKHSGRNKLVFTTLSE